MQSTTILLCTAYLGPAEYYAAMLSHQKIIIEQHEFFVKQSYRNRCEILGANGKMVLSIPLQVRKNKSLTKDIRVDYKTPWQMQHWRAIKSAYSSSPFFEYYQDDLLPYYEKQVEFLLDFNLVIQEKIAELIGIKLNFSLSESYVQEIENKIDARNSFSPKLNSEKIFPNYIQVFENKFPFVPNLSILDLLFNLGNESEIYLRSIR